MKNAVGRCRKMIIDEILPEFDVREVHSITVMPFHRNNSRIMLFYLDIL
jgi:hypothetical protein